MKRLTFSLLIVVLLGVSSGSGIALGSRAIDVRVVKARGYTPVKKAQYHPGRSQRFLGDNSTEEETVASTDSRVNGHLKVPTGGQVKVSTP